MSCIRVGVEPESASPRRQFVTAALLCTLGGLSCGLGLGFIPFYLNFDAINDRCGDFTGREACEDSPRCQWTDIPTNTSSPQSDIPTNTSF
jgi:hypothetical protein